MLNKDSLEKILLEELSKFGDTTEEFKKGFEACLNVVCRIFRLKK